MAHKYDHLRQKAIRLRTEQHLTLDAIVERLRLPRTTVYYWIRDLPIPPGKRRDSAPTPGQRKAAAASRARYAAKREAAYRQGWAEAPELLQDPSFRDFVVLYMAEGYRRHRNRVSFVNSDARMVVLANR